MCRPNITSQKWDGKFFFKKLWPEVNFKVTLDIPSLSYVASCPSLDFLVSAGFLSEEAAKRRRDEEARPSPRWQTPRSHPMRSRTWRSGFAADAVPAAPSRPASSRSRETTSTRSSKPWPRTASGRSGRAANRPSSRPRLRERGGTSFRGPCPCGPQNRWSRVPTPGVACRP